MAGSSRVRQRIAPSDTRFRVVVLRTHYGMVLLAIIPSAALCSQLAAMTQVVHADAYIFWCRHIPDSAVAAAVRPRCNASMGTTGFPIWRLCMRVRDCRLGGVTGKFSETHSTRHDNQDNNNNNNHEHCYGLADHA